MGRTHRINIAEPYRFTIKIDLHSIRQLSRLYTYSNRSSLIRDECDGGLAILRELLDGMDAGVAVEKEMDLQGDDNAN